MNLSDKRSWLWKAPQVCPAAHLGVTLPTHTLHPCRLLDPLLLGRAQCMPAHFSLRCPRYRLHAPAANLG